MWRRSNSFRALIGYSLPNKGLEPIASSVCSAPAFRCA
jgi:hypothetical protein